MKTNNYKAGMMSRVPVPAVGAGAPRKQIGDEPSPELVKQSTSKRGKKGKGLVKVPPPVKNGRRRRLLLESTGGEPSTMMDLTQNVSGTGSYNVTSNSLELVNSNATIVAHDPAGNIRWNAGGKYYVEFDMDLSGNIAASGITGNFIANGNIANDVAAPTNYSGTYTRFYLFQSSGNNTTIDPTIWMGFPGSITFTALEKAEFAYDKNEVNATNIYHVGVGWDLDNNKVYVNCNGTWLWDAATGNTTGGDPSGGDPGFPVAGGSTNEAIAMWAFSFSGQQTGKVATLQFTTPYYLPAGFEAMS